MSDASFSAHFLTALSANAPLRVGLILPGSRVGRATASIVRDLVEASFVRLELVVVDAPEADDAPSQLRRDRAAGGLVYAALAGLDRRRVGAPEAREDIGPLLAGIPSHAFRSPGDGPHSPSTQLVTKVRDAALDVLVHLGSRPLHGDILTASRHGVWALQPGDGFDSGDPPWLAELLSGDPVCSVVLIRLDDAAVPAGDRRPLGVVIDRATFALDQTSLARTRRQAEYGSTHLVVRALRLLHARGPDGLAGAQSSTPVLAPTRPQTARTGSPPPDRSPSPIAILRWLVPLAVRRAGARIVRTVTRRDDVLHWRVAIRVGHSSRLVDRPDDLRGFQWHESPRGHYYADPFVVERDGRRWLFVEDYVYARGAAGIACAELGADGRIGPMREALRSDGHLSYPMVVDDGGELVMVPESAEDRVVRRYRPTEFPFAWSSAGELLPEPGVDTTILRRDDRWWLFTTIPEPRGGAGMLMLFHATALDGPWTPHPLNPISQDVRTSRGGGLLIEDDGRLLRPSQDGSRGYGYALTFNEVVVLTPNEYAERPAATVTPDGVRGLLGIHTYSRVADIEVIDGKVRRPRRAVA